MKHARRRAGFRPILLLTLFGAWCGGLNLAAQVMDPALAGMGPSGYGLGYRPGLRLNSISAFSTYVPSASGSLVAGGNNSNRGLMNGVTGSGGWSKQWLSSSLSLMYAGGYSRAAQSGDSTQTFHNLGLGYFTNLKLTPRWDYSGRVDGRIMDFDSYLYLPGNANNIVATTPAGIGLSGITSADTIAGSPANFALFGSRLLTATLGNTFAFRKSERLMYRIGITGAYTRFVGSRSGTAPGQPLFGVTYATANAGLTYNLTPRTYLIGDVAVSRGFSSFVNNYFSNALAGVGRTIKPWWLVQVQGGIGYNFALNGTVPSRPRLIGGVSTAFQAYGQSLTLDANMTAADPFGIGAGTSLTGSARWSLHRPSSRWAVMASAMETMSRGLSTGAFTAWNASVGINRILTDQLFFTLSGGYTNVTSLSNFGGADGGVGGAFGTGRFGYRGVRAALTWTPTKLRW